MAGRSSPPEPASEPAAAPQRLDKWLWFARIAKTRSLAVALVEGGKVRVNKVRATKPGAQVKVGDIITCMLRGEPRVFKITDIADRRGGAKIAATLYEDLAPKAQASPTEVGKLKSLDPLAAQASQSGVREGGAGRPTKRERRATDRLRDT